MKLKNCMLASLCLCVSQFVLSQAIIRPLKIGELVPSITIKNVVNYSTSEISLKKLKGKVIIIDFWGKTCSSCIKALPEMDCLQRKYKDSIQIITISDIATKAELLKTFARFEITQDLKLASALINPSLAAYFPHLLVSHIVWINTDGRVAAFTNSDYVTEKHVQQILRNKTVNWPVKSDLPEFDYRKPLLGLKEKTLASPSFMYYSALTAYIDGIAPPSGTEIDSATQCSMTSFYNTSLFDLCMKTMNRPSREDIFLSVKDPSRYIYNDSGYQTDWLRANTYCYSLRIALKYSQQEIDKLVAEDLSRWLAMLGIKIITQRIMVNGKEKISYTITD